MAQKIKDSKKLTEELLKKLEIKANIEVEEVDETTQKVSISGEDLGVLIGYHGKTLEALKLVLGLMVNKGREESDVWTRVLVDVGGWRTAREDSLREMAERAASRVRSYKESVALPPMNASDRRVIHVALQEEIDIVSESEGEGEERRVIVKLKK